VSCHGKDDFKVKFVGESTILIPKKEEYTYEDVHINIVHEEETVKVRIKAAKEEKEDAEG
jgi:hypothetical protein